MLVIRSSLIFFFFFLRWGFHSRYPPLCLCLSRSRSTAFTNLWGTNSLNLVFMGIYSWVFHECSEEMCGYSKHFTQKLGGYSCFGEGIRVYFFDFLRMFEYWILFFCMLSRILWVWDTLEYFGILWNTLKCFAKYLWKNGIPNTKEYLPRVNPEYSSNTLWIPTVEYPWNTFVRIPGYSSYPTNTTEYLASKIVEYHWIRLNTFTQCGNKTIMTMNSIPMMNTHEY